jgi:hypothetical protein
MVVLEARFSTSSNQIEPLAVVRWAGGQTFVDDPKPWSIIGHSDLHRTILGIGGAAGNQCAKMESVTVHTGPQMRRVKPRS